MNKLRHSLAVLVLAGSTVLLPPNAEAFFGFFDGGGGFGFGFHGHSHGWGGPGWYGSRYYYPYNYYYAPWAYNGYYPYYQYALPATEADKD